jgi:hypothetical protein
LTATENRECKLDPQNAAGTYLSVMITRISGRGRSC